MLLSFHELFHEENGRLIYNDKYTTGFCSLIFGNEYNSFRGKFLSENKDRSYDIDIIKNNNTSRANISYSQMFRDKITGKISVISNGKNSLRLQSEYIRKINHKNGTFAINGIYDIKVGLFSFKGSFYKKSCIFLKNINAIYGIESTIIPKLYMGNITLGGLLYKNLSNSIIGWKLNIIPSVLNLTFTSKVLNYFYITLGYETKITNLNTKYLIALSHIKKIPNTNIEMIISSTWKSNNNGFFSCGLRI